jgi:hypothetical protein
MNKCDRLDEPELKNRILLDFSAYIQAAWQTSVDHTLCVSARRHLTDPQWDQAAVPKHDFDQFEELQNLIFDSINRTGYVLDRRLENTRSLRDFVFGEVEQELSGYNTSLETAKQKIREAEKKSFLEAVTTMKNDDTRQLFGIGLMVYQKLAQQWVGPMGWVIAIWARLLIFGTGMAALFRFGRPVTQIMGMISAWKHFKESKSATADARSDERVGAGLRTYRLATMSSWPDIAESLIGGGFDGAVRRVDDALPGGDRLSEKISGIWSGTLESEIERVSRKLSGILLQIVFNLPAFGILGYSGWITVKGFLLGEYLAGSFFLHALCSIVIILLLSFFIFQAFVRLVAGPERVTTKAFEKMKRQAEHSDLMASNPVLLQLETVIELSALLASRQSG